MAARPPLLLRAADEGQPEKLPPTSSVVLKDGRRLRPGGATSRDAALAPVAVQADEAVRVQFANGRHLWLRADELLSLRGLPSAERGAAGQAVWDLDLSAPGDAEQRGLLSVGIKVLEVFGIDLQKATAGLLADKVDKRQLRDRAPGLYRVAMDARGALSPPGAADSLPGRKPLLVFLHGTMSNFTGSFGGLFGNEGEATVGVDAPAQTRAALARVYGEHVYAFEHRTLTESPIANALALAKRLPDDAELHLVSHSRGGLVGELMALSGRRREDDPLALGLIDRLFGAVDPRPPGLPPMKDEALKALRAAYAADGRALKELLKLLDEKRIVVRRFVRVACPARGTTLASGRLDRWLGVVQALVPDSFVGDTLDFLLAVLKERTDARAMPGIEAMLPGSALSRLLNQSGIVTSADLSVIAGDLEPKGGGGLSAWWSQLKLFVTDWFYGSDHDLVVNTGSMRGGLARTEGAGRALVDSGPEVTHFRYFNNPDSLGWLVGGLTRSDDSQGGFGPLLPAPRDEPRWRAAVARSARDAGSKPIVLFVPGAMGSGLAVDGSTVWLKFGALALGGMKRIRINASGVEVGEPLDDFYAPFIEHLADAHRVELFPYDWRRSVRSNAALMAAKLAPLVDEAAAKGVPLHIAAHSMGGIVTRCMIADGGPGAELWARMGRLPGGSRLLMIGTPNHGSYEAVRWLTGFNPTQAKLALLDLTRGTDGLIDIVRRYPGLLELLPFGDAAIEERFGGEAFWQNLRDEMAAGFAPAEQKDLDEARATWLRLRGTAVDAERMRYVAGCARATVIDHALVDDEAWPKKRPVWYATAEGDGTVTWDSGRLPGVPVWYAPDTAHDALCANAADSRIFAGYVELLSSGSTTRLPSSPPQTARGGGAARTRFELVQPPLDALPDEASLRGAGFGGGGGMPPTAPPAALTTIEVSVRHADLAHAAHPVMVGHYMGDLIVSAEAHLDRRLDGALDRRYRLGRYPGPQGTHAIFFDERRDRRPGVAAGARRDGRLAGAVVVGLGQVGDLTPALLQAGVRDAMLDYAQAVAESAGPDAGRQSARLSCLLVGTGGAGLAVRDSLESILRAAIDTNLRLCRAGSQERVQIDALEFIELYEDVAIGAALALGNALRAMDIAAHVRWSDAVLRWSDTTGGRKRRHFDTDRSWDKRVEILEDQGNGLLRYAIAGQRARIDLQLATGQVALAESFIARAVGSTRHDAKVARTLYEMLLPVEFREATPDTRGLVLMLDPRSARFPWELLEDRASVNGRPLAIEAGMVRQFKVDAGDSRAEPQHAAERAILVVGDPDLEGWPAFRQLPGARDEAAAVRELFEARWTATAVQHLIGARVDAIAMALHERPWRVLHLAGHGEHLWSEKPGDPPRSGMLIGRGTFLTAGDVRQLRYVPELVFVNCCHLGRTDGSAPAYGRLAANIGAEFISMGARAVVAAGWAVDDQAAVTFATRFYRELLDGAAFRDAVRQARMETWQRHPGVNTWGAFQCYGDPGWRLVHDSSAGGGAKDAAYVSVRELLADLDNLLVGARSHKDMPPAQHRERIRACLARVPASARGRWERRADVAAAVGFCYAEGRIWADALEWLDRALASPEGDCPVRVLEQSLNALARQAVEQHATDGPGAKRRLVAAIERFEPLVRQAPTAERWVLMGSACKRLAQMQADDERGRVISLKHMGGHYGRAFDAATAADDLNQRLYTLGNWAVACALLGRVPAASQEPPWKPAMHELLTTLADLGDKHFQAQPEFWTAAAMADLHVAWMLLDADDAAAVRRHREAAAEWHKRQQGFDASARQRSSGREHLAFLIALTAGREWPAAAGAALQTLKAGLEGAGEAAAAVPEPPQRVSTRRTA